MRSVKTAPKATSLPVKDRGFKPIVLRRVMVE